MPQGGAGRCWTGQRGGKGGGREAGDRLQQALGRWVEWRQKGGLGFSPGERGGFTSPGACSLLSSCVPELPGPHVEVFTL